MILLSFLILIDKYTLRTYNINLSKFIGTLSHPIINIHSIRLWLIVGQTPSILIKYAKINDGFFILDKIKRRTLRACYECAQECGATGVQAFHANCIPLWTRMRAQLNALALPSLKSFTIIMKIQSSCHWSDFRKSSQLSTKLDLISCFRNICSLKIP